MNVTLPSHYRPVLDNLLAGKRPKAIAAALQCNECTIKMRMRQLYAWFGVSDCVALVSFTLLPVGHPLRARSKHGDVPVVIRFAAALCLALLLCAPARAEQPPPRSFMHNGVRWAVQPVQQDISCTGQHDMGCTDCATHVVRINVADSGARSIMLHELMHVVTACSDERDNLHMHIYDISPELYSLLRRNKPLRRWLWQ